MFAACHLRHLIETGGRTGKTAYVERVGRGGPFTEMMRAYSNSRSGNLGLWCDDANAAQCSVDHDRFVACHGDRHPAGLSCGASAARGHWWQCSTLADCLRHWGGGLGLFAFYFTVEAANWRG